MRDPQSNRTHSEDTIPRTLCLRRETRINEYVLQVLAMPAFYGARFIASRKAKAALAASSVKVKGPPPPSPPFAYKAPQNTETKYEYYSLLFSVYMQFRVVWLFTLRSVRIKPPPPRFAHALSCADFIAVSPFYLLCHLALYQAFEKRKRDSTLSAKAQNKLKCLEERANVRRAIH